jgi:hypothetical protein
MTSTDVSTQPVDPAASLFAVDESALPQPQPESQVALRVSGASVMLSVIGGIALSMIVATQVALYYAARPGAEEWVAAKPDTYDGFALVVLLIVAAFCAQWIRWSVNNEARRQAIGASGGLILSSLAFLNLGWFHMDKLEYRAVESAYTLVAWTLQLTVGAAVAACLVGGVVLFIKTLFGAQGRTNQDDARAVSLFTSMTLVVSLVVYWLIWYVK